MIGEYDQDEAECRRLWYSELTSDERNRLIDWSDGEDVTLSDDEQLAVKWFARTMIMRVMTME